MAMDAVLGGGTRPPQGAAPSTRSLATERRILEVGADPSQRGDSEDFWRDFLTRGDAMERRVRRAFRLLPHGPRCKLCAAPFSGVGAPLMRMIGRRASDKNPTMCASCFDFMAKHHGGAEIECSFLFADVRGSTSLAEGIRGLPGSVR